MGSVDGGATVMDAAEIGEQLHRHLHKITLLGVKALDVDADFAEMAAWMDAIRDFDRFMGGISDTLLEAIRQFKPRMN